MTPYKFIATIAFMLIWNITYSQEKHSFESILTRGEVGKTFISGTQADSSWRTFLGEIEDSNGKVRYYVVKEFKKVQAASNWHGHNNIFFFSPKQQLVARVDVGLPEGLPYKLKNGFLYFKVIENGSTSIYKVKVEAPLPKLLCLKPDRCEDIIPENSSVQH